MKTRRLMSVAEQKLALEMLALMLELYVKGGLGDVSPEAKKFELAVSDFLKMVNQ